LFVLLLGAPGSGKGTQGKIVAERLGLPKITTGDILREAVKAGTPLGVQAKKYMDDGKLVPDAVILSLIEARGEGRGDLRRLSTYRRPGGARRYHPRRARPAPQ